MRRENNHRVVSEREVTAARTRKRSQFIGIVNNNKTNAEIMEAFQAFDNVRAVGFARARCYHPLREKKQEREENPLIN